MGQDGLGEETYLGHAAPALFLELILKPLTQCAHSVNLVDVLLTLIRLFLRALYHNTVISIQSA